MGRYKNPQICQADLLRSVSQVLQPVRIEVRKFDKILDDAKSSQDFVYFDPPYYPISSTSYFTAYSRDSFNKDDQVRLKELFAELAKDWVQVMLSNSDCELIRELYSDFKIHPILALRGINSDAKKRGKISEVLVTSY